MDTNTALGVALFGVGRIGSIHLQHLTESRRCQLLWLVEEDTGRAEAFLATHQGPVTANAEVVSCANMETVLKDPRVGAVLVCTPSFTHTPIIQAALKAGKAVFCEKPLAPSAEDTQACYDLATENNKPLFCAFNRRYDPQIRGMYSKIQTGAIGTIRSMRIVSRDPGGHNSAAYIKASGGIFVDSAIHDIDIACWLSGQQPETVYAIGHATTPLYAQCDDVDTCMVVLKFPSGAICTIEVSREGSYGYDQRIEVFGTSGMIMSENQRPQNTVTYTTNTIKHTDIEANGFRRYMDAYTAELHHFFNLITGKAESEVTESSTMTVINIVEICNKHINSGQAVNYKEWVANASK